MALRLLDVTVVIVGLLILREWHRSGIDDVLLWYLIPVVSLTVAGVFQTLGVYDCLHLGDLKVWCSRVLLAWAVVLGLFFGGVYAFKVGTDLPRLVVGPWALSTAACLIGIRIVLYVLMVRRHRRGISGHRVILVGEHAHCRRLARHLSAAPALGLRVCGICTDAPRGDGQGERFRVLGGIADLPALAQDLRAERVIIAGPASDLDLPIRVMGHLSVQAVTVQYAPELSRYGLLGFQAADYDGQPVLNLSASPLDGAGVVAKWLEDKILAIAILVPLSVLLVVIAVAIKATSRGPVFFVQQRHGLHGRPIRVLKFRTMHVPDNTDEAEAARAGRETTPSGRFRQASGGDRRITALGGFLRRTSLDELPQFLNVLKGDMSIVGPRPHPIGLNLHYAELIDGLMRRHYVKPGITGLAQISGSRGETRTVDDMRLRLRYDLEYIRTWSVWLDLRIIAKTVWKGFVNLQP